MSVIFQKLRRRLERDSELPLSLRLRSHVLAGARFVIQAAGAPIALRGCDEVGAWARTVGGAPSIKNEGHIAIGSHAVITSTFSPVRLVTAKGGSLVVGDRAVINFGTLLSAQLRVEVGSDVSFGPYCVVSDSAIESHRLDDHQPAPITIGSHVWLAGRVTILPGSSIGDGSVVTAGSIVSGHIPSGVIAGGNPARVIRRITPAEYTQKQVAASVLDTASLHAQPSVAELTTIARAGYESSPQAVEHSGETAANPSIHPSAYPSAVALPSSLAELPAPPRIALRGLVVADSTVDDYASRLSEDTDLPLVDAEVAPFGQVVPTLVSLKNESTPPDLVVVWTRPQSSVPSFQRILDFETVDEASLLAEVDAFAALLVETLAHVQCVIVPTWTLPSYIRGWGLLDTRSFGATRALYAMNLRLMDRLADATNIHPLNAQRWVESGGKLAQNPKLWYLGKIAFNSETFAEAVKDTKATLSAIGGGARKLIVLDLDDTLWGGIVGDAGWENLRLGGHDSVGEALVDFQRILKSLKRRGIILAIASKNEESVALEAIRSHPEMVLREDDFVAWRINWNDKAANIAELAVELNIGLQSVVFIDDNPVERGRVREQLPEVLVPEWPEDKLLYPSALLSLRCFDSAAVTQEDAERTGMYVAERRRTAERSSIGSMEEWLETMAVEVRASRLNAANAARASQLLNKTNQLNLSTRRLTQAELQAWAEDPNRDIFVVSVSDRYGDSGLTGIVSIEAKDDAAQVVDYLLSCRVMGRKVEETLLHLAVESARSRGLSRVKGQLVPTAKNKPCLTFWQHSGFDKLDEYTFEWDASQPYPCPRTISLAFTD